MIAGAAILLLFKGASSSSTGDSEGYTRVIGTDGAYALQGGTETVSLRQDDGTVIQYSRFAESESTFTKPSESDTGYGR